MVTDLPSGQSQNSHSIIFSPNKSSVRKRLWNTWFIPCNRKFCSLLQIVCVPVCTYVCVLLSKDFGYLAYCIITLHIVSKSYNTSSTEGLFGSACLPHIFANSAQALLSVKFDIQLCIIYSYMVYNFHCWKRPCLPSPS